MTLGLRSLNQIYCPSRALSCIATYFQPTSHRAPRVQRVCRLKSSLLFRHIFPGYPIRSNSNMASADNPFRLGAEGRKFLDDFYKLILDEALMNGSERDTKVVDFQFPTDLTNLMDVTIKAEPENTEKLLELGKKVIQYSIKTGHPRFFNQLYSGINPYTLAGSWLTEALNTNIHTFEVAPVFVILEKYMFTKLCSYVGFADGNGVFCPGGSFVNFMALQMARYSRFPNLKKTGMMNSPRLLLYTSEEAHYSLKKASAFMGFGTDSIVTIKCDERGKMIPEVLQQKVLEAEKQGHIPLLVMPTCGTTVLGGYDPLPAIADICQEHNIWMHTDAAWGGGVLFSDKHKHLMKAIERSDSVSWNLHKMSGTLLQCSAFLVKEKDLLLKCNSAEATYLFQQDKFYDTTYDIGDKSVQCGRKVDVLKLWLMWKGLGDIGMARAVDSAFENSQYLTQKLRQTDGFRLVIPEFECTNICFWYIPPSLRGHAETSEWWDKLRQVAPVIKERMILKGSMMIGYTPLPTKGLVNFFRIIIDNSLQTHKDMDFVVEEINRLGKDL